MGESSGFDPPLKRVRHTRRRREPYQRKNAATVSSPANVASASATPVDDLRGFFPTGTSIFDNTWPLPPDLLANTTMLLAAAPPKPTLSWASSALQPGHDLELSPTTPVSTSQQHASPNRYQRLLPAGSEWPPANDSPDSYVDRLAAQLRVLLTSPFNDNYEPLIPAEKPKYGRPDGGSVNGYIKFHWPQTKDKVYSSGPIGVSFRPSMKHGGTLSAAASCSSNTTTLIGSASSPGHITMSPASSESSWIWAPGSSPMDATPVSPQSDIPMHMMLGTDPRLLPPHFGFHAKMDFMDRRLWEFYIKNWCPGRSILSNTNLWLNDFAKMHENEGIRCAIQSLAGVYIHDYLPDDKIRRRINQRYALADAHFGKLLVDPQSVQTGQGQEVITMAVILSMQDVVLTERRLKKPHKPRWLEGFRQGEYFLQKTDDGGRFWKDNNVQMPALRVSQSIVVGRAVILAQPMMVLPSPATLDPQQESARFGWLLYGCPKDIYEIHGGCGFSKKLLHLISQITYCAARLQQARDSAIVPITAQYLLRELTEMRQWSSESMKWEDALKRPHTILWIRKMTEGHIINTNGEMTDVTAEAWRIAAIVYLQCRVLRLPRNHPEVVSNLADLARCIRIMPTSGSHFTAQAPLLPVFLLGLLATVSDHKEVSRQWFEQVVKTPVRSSVPPLYQALNRIWTWIDAEVELRSPLASLPDAIGKRRPWWERLVAVVHEREEETLCLT